MTTLHLSYLSASAVVYCEKGGHIASVQSISSRAQGMGHGSAMVRRIEKIVNNRKNITEIWYPTVISDALAHILDKLNYDYTNFGPHPMMPDSGDVFGYKKTLERKK